MWYQTVVLRKYEEFMGVEKWSKERVREVDRWVKEIMHLVMLSRLAVTLEFVRRLFDGY
jgi:hypothetical protein